MPPGTGDVQLTLSRLVVINGMCADSHVGVLMRWLVLFIGTVIVSTPYVRQRTCQHHYQIYDTEKHIFVSTSVRVAPLATSMPAHIATG